VRAAGVGSWASTRHPEHLTYIERRTDSKEERGRKSGEIPGQLSQAPLCLPIRGQVKDVYFKGRASTERARVSRQLLVLLLFHLSLAFMIYHTFLPFFTLQIGKLRFKIPTQL